MVYLGIVLMCACGLIEKCGWVFLTGKYSDEPSQSDEWFKKGKMVSTLLVR